MYKMVLHDYRLHFKDALKSLSSSEWYIYIYLIAIAPTIIGIDNSLLEYYFFLIPLLISLIISRMYGGLMGKTFYLCPLSKEQRKSYIFAGMQLRTFFPIVLFIVLNGILVIFEILSPMLFMLELFVMVCASISFNIYCQPVVKSNNSTERFYPLLGNYELYKTLAQYSAMFSLFIFPSWEEFEIFGKTISVIPLAFQLFICIKIIRLFYPQIICQADYFEKTV